MKTDKILLNQYEVLDCVSSITNVPVEYILLSDKAPGARKREYVLSRQLSIYILRTYCHFSLANAGKAVERDHATALYSIKTIINLAWSNVYIKELVNAIIDKCKAENKKINQRTANIKAKEKEPDIKLINNNVISIHPRVI